ANILLTITPYYLADNAYYLVQLSWNPHTILLTKVCWALKVPVLLIGNVITTLIARLKNAERLKFWRKYA
ncbi:hypothetical protein LXA39_17520, partial [Erwinia amylovora]|uniref:hypothetical protein n=1 Tax=Erwinia amylovora TaxID=552 RepID=UPI0020C17EDF